MKYNSIFVSSCPLRIRYQELNMQITYYGRYQAEKMERETGETWKVIRPRWWWSHPERREELRMLQVEAPSLQCSSKQSSVGGGLEP